MKKFLSFLAVLLCFAVLAGCGSTAASSAADQTSAAAASAAASSAAETEQAAAPAAEEAAPAAAEEASAAEAAEASAAEEDFSDLPTISYPLDGDHTFSIAINPNGLISSIMGEDGFTMSAAYPAMEEATGCKLDWTLYSEATFNEQFNLMMASQDWPDLFDCGVTSRYSTGVTGLLEDDVVVELSDYLQEYAPDYYKLLQTNQGFSECIVQEDGSVVEFATASQNYADKGMMIRQDWLDELGLEAPTTVDELTEVLRAFRDNYGLTMSLMVCSGLDTGLTNAYNIDSRGMSNSGLGWVVEDGEVKCTYTTDGFKAYLELLNGYYAEGIFNDDFVNISYELNTVDSTYLDGKCGVFYASVSALSESQKANASDPNFRLTALPDIKVNADDGNSGVTEISYTGINSIAISTQCDDPEAAMEFCNYFYTDEGRLLANWGVEGETYTINDEGLPEFTEMVANDTECFMYMLTETKYSLQWAPTIFDARLTTSAYDDAQLAAAEMWTSEREAYALIPKNATSTEEEQNIENQYGSDVATYMWEHIFKIVTNQEPLDSYDDVIATATEMGLDKLVEARQASYDRYMEAHPEG